MTCCHLCGLPILAERHDCHHTTCPNHGTETRVDCDCYLPAHPWCCTTCSLPIPYERLARTEIPGPTGLAVIETARCAPDADWTLTVDAPGIDLHQWTYTTGSQAAAKEMHRATVEAVQEQVDTIPTIDMRHGSRVDGYDPDDREPMGGDPYWTRKDPA